MMIRNYFMKSATLAWITTAIAGLLVSVPSPAADANWHVKEAPVRFKISLKEKPSEKSSGYLLHLPDGGILPGAFPLTHVVTESGKQLASYVMWQSKGNGVLLVFEDPGAEGNAFVYVSGSDKLKTWTPQTGLTPGPVICAEQGTESMDTARNLSKTGQVGPLSYFQKYGTSMAPFGMTGDVQGRPNPMCYYVLAYLITTDPGRTLVAMTVFNGNVQLRLDGQLVTPQRISSKPGGMGQWMELSKGLHKAEVYCSIGLTGTGKKQVGVGGREIMSKEQLCAWTMGWRPPNTKIEDLGGPRPKDLPAPGSPMWESHKINPEEISRSGSCKIMEINSKDGSPVAVCKLESTETFWFDEETPPIFTYELTAVAAGNPEDSQYTWSFGDAAKLSGQKIAWFFRRGMQTVNMTASSRGKQSTCSIPFYAFSGARSSMDSPETKSNFRKACLSMIKGYPIEADPTATWNDTMWNCFYDAQEFGKGSDLLDEVLTRRWIHFSKKVKIEKQIMLEDIFFNWISQIDADKAIKWLVEQERSSPSAERKNDLRIMQAEVLIYQKAKYDDAKKMLAPIAKGTGDAAATATVRLGDIAFLEKNMNEAVNYWSAVQNKVKMTQDDIKGEGSQIKWDDGSTDKDKKKNKPIEPDPKAFTSNAIKNEKVDAWKKAATWETSKALNVTTLLTQGFPLEAYQELRRWERNLPMSKINSDYVIQEANFYMIIGNAKRARKLLESYCENVDASAYVANAAELLLQCMMKDKESDKALRKFCEDMKKRFEFHPLVERMDDLMRVIGADGIKREATLDKL
ncbi:MAG: hypothetical protein A2283_19905 [Lentisphaerae bacterium RIFOXYA12_FULL_48_11]|nr:MAG: hypothetical protein A2283_19905 [Lentisphaerae bacterium RIFOXYA12_FULL_48_11]